MIIDLAKERADAMAKAVGAPRGTFLVSPVANGNIAIQCMQGDVLLWRRDITIAEARALQQQIQRACAQAQSAFRSWHGLVQLAWCRPDGEMVRANTIHNRVRGRIIERADTGARIVIEPERGTPEPRDGWPTEGWYHLSGWLMGHSPRRRGWRVISGLESREGISQ